MRGVGGPESATAIYIAGTMRSGTTWLGALLAEQTGLLFIGELSGLVTDTARGGRCSCGSLIHDCVLWGPTLGLLEVDGVDFHQLEAANDIVGRRLRLRRYLLWSRFGFREPRRSRSGRLEAEQAIASIPPLALNVCGAEGWIDSSKSLPYLSICEQSGAAVKIVHIVRAPLRVAQSEKSTRRFGQHGSHFMPPGKTALHSALTWSLTTYLWHRRLRHRFGDSITVAYEDLRENQLATLEGICRVLGLPRSSEETESLIHAAVGNPTRMQTTQIQQRRDSNSLNFGERLTVRLITAPVRVILRRQHDIDY